MASRRLIKEIQSIERINLSDLWFYLKDFAIDLEIQRDYYHDIINLIAPSQNPDKFSILDKIQQLYNKKHKTSVEKLIEQYKMEFDNSKNKTMKIRLNDSNKKRISDLVKSLPEK